MLAMQTDATNPECPDPHTLRQYVAGRLDEPQLGQCEAHLVDCPRCDDTIRGLRVDETANDSFDHFALSALKDGADSPLTSHADAPLVDQIIRDLVEKAPRSDQAVRALQNRAVEVTRLLPSSSVNGSIGCIGDYEIKRLLGAGSTGIVYEAEDAKLQRRVALKVLRPSLGDAARDRFMNEARAAAAISHLNVITIYQVGVEGPLAFIAMELSEGQTLEARLSEVTFVPEEKVKQIALQVANGLKAAHSHGLIHRDIKPANIWLKSKNDQAVILDFGLARIADDDPQMTATGMLAGTPNFMSPEQTRGLELDGRSDLFSLGCLMYRAATGKLPFGSTGILATLQAIQHDQPRPPLLLNPHLSEDFSDLVMTLLEKQPVNRPANADDLTHALENERASWSFAAAAHKNQTVESTKHVAKPSVIQQGKTVGLRRWVTAATLALVTGILGWHFSPQIIRIATDHGELVIDAKDKAVEVAVFQGGKLVRVIDTKSDQSIDIKAGEYELRLKESENGFRLNSDRVVLTRGGKEIVSIIASTGRKVPTRAITKKDEQRVKLINNMRQVTLSLLNYESSHMQFPTIGNRDANGKLLLSWRVHVLPFIEHLELYERFRLDEPWNSPHNLELLPLMPEIYGDPANPETAGVTKTRIQIPSGNGFLLDPERWKSVKPESDKGMGMDMGMGRANHQPVLREGIGFEDITDGSSNTLALIQVNDANAVQWTRPVDWDGDPKKLEPSEQSDSDQVHFFMANGSNRHLPIPIDAVFLKALLTRGGGEVLYWNNLTARQPSSPTPTAARKRVGPPPSRMDDGMDMGGMDMGIDMGMGMDRQSAKPPILYDGKNFKDWLFMLQTDRQPRSQFMALVATAELARYDKKMRDKVMPHLIQLLRRFGSNTLGSFDSDAVPRASDVPDTPKDEQVTQIFLDTLRRFEPDELMELAFNEVKDGNPKSRDFLSFVFFDTQIYPYNSKQRVRFWSLLEDQSGSLAKAILTAVENVEADDLVALTRLIAQIDRWQSRHEIVGGTGIKYLDEKLNRSSYLIRHQAWLPKLQTAFESGDPRKQACVAAQMVDWYPDQPKYVSRLGEIFADESLDAEIRMLAFFPIEKLAAEQVKPATESMITVARQTGKTKSNLSLAARSLGNHGWNYQFNSTNGYPVTLDLRLASMLGNQGSNAKAALPWLDQLREQWDKKSPGTDEKPSATVQRIDEAIEKIQGNRKVDPEPQNGLPSFGVNMGGEGGVF